MNHQGTSAEVRYPSASHLAAPETRARERANAADSSLWGRPNLLSGDGTAILVENFLPADEADQLFRTVMADLNWEQHERDMFGKTHDVPRLIAWYGPVPYRYSGIFHPAAPWPDQLKGICQAVSAAVGVPFNTVLANRYDTGAHKVGPHGDNEAIFGADPTIASLSLGATRRFSIRHRKQRNKVDLDLRGGTLLIMAGAMQRYWDHSVPATKRMVGPRVNPTFRLAHDPARQEHV